jgi:hypothetical protein
MVMSVEIGGDGGGGDDDDDLLVLDDITSQFGGLEWVYLRSGL